MESSTGSELWIVLYERTEIAVSVSRVLYTRDAVRNEVVVGGDAPRADSHGVCDHECTLQQP